MDDKTTEIVPNLFSEVGFEKEDTLKIIHKTTMPRDYIDLECLEVKKSDIQKISKECHEYSRTNGSILEILVNIFLGLATTFLGIVLSGIFALYASNQWQFWFCYLVCPTLFMGCTFGYILLLICKKHKKDKLQEAVVEKLLRPAGFWEDEKDD